MAECVICENPTDSATRGVLGDQAGVICEDCAYWADGNVETS